MSLAEKFGEEPLASEERILPFFDSLYLALQRGWCRSAAELDFRTYIEQGEEGLIAVSDAAQIARMKVAFQKWMEARGVKDEQLKQYLRNPIPRPEIIQPTAEDVADINEILRRMTFQSNNTIVRATPKRYSVNPEEPSFYEADFQFQVRGANYFFVTVCASIARPSLNGGTGHILIREIQGSKRSNVSGFKQMYGIHPFDMAVRYILDAINKPGLNNRWIIGSDIDRAYPSSSVTVQKFFPESSVGCAVFDSTAWEKTGEATFSVLDGSRKAASKRISSVLAPAA